MARPISVEGFGWFPSIQAAAKALEVNPYAVLSWVESKGHPGWRWGKAGARRASSSPDPLSEYGRKDISAGDRDDSTD